MVNLIRRFQQPLMIFITFLVIIAFVWLYNSNDFTRAGGDERVGMLYGRTISRTAFQREARKVDLAAGLTRELLDSLAGRAMNREEAITDFIWNTLVLRHEAERLALAPTPAEIEDAIKKLPPFRTNDVYDSSKYKMFITQALAPRGLGADALEELIGDQLRLEKIKGVLGTTITPSAAELRELFEVRNAKLETSVVRWKFEDFARAQQVSDDDVKKAYEERKTTLMTEEQRKVKFVALVLPKTDKPLAGKERADALTPLSSKAEEFAIAMTEKGAKFGDVAAKLGVPVQETQPFTAETPPPELADVPGVASAAFPLTKEQPHSDPVQTENGFYLMELSEIIPARQQTFDEAGAKLAETLKNERATEAMNLKATEIRNKIETDLKAGKVFADAAAAAGVKAEKLPPFSFGEPPKEPENREVMIAARDLKEGQLSAFQPSGMGEIPTGGLIVFLEKKQPIDEAKFTQEKPQLAEQFDRTLREAVFAQWLQQRRLDAGVPAPAPTPAAS